MGTWNKYGNWNPWHGCHKISPGCKYCYVYRQDERYGTEVPSSQVRKTRSFDLPLKRKRDKSYKIESGTLLFTCFSSDFFVEDADEWRTEAWKMIKKRSDLIFYIFTKRIDRFYASLPADWGEGYPNVIVGCTIENQDRADYRIPLFKRLPIKHKTIICAPLLEKIDLSPYLDSTIEEVAASGESGNKARICDYNWVLDIREQCIKENIPFCFHQTGARFLKDGKLYHVKRCFQVSQAAKAGIDFGLQR